MECIDVGGTKLYWMNTPWDQKFFSLKTIEIIKIEDEDSTNLKECLIQLSKITSAELTYGRFNAANFVAKKVFYSLGYYSAETSASVILPNLREYSLPNIYNNRLLTIQSFVASDAGWIIKNIGESFRYSRFHEDPNLDNRLCANRMTGWSKDLIQKATECVVFKLHATPHCFMFYEINNNQVTLILGGSVKGSELHAPFFWASVINYFKGMGVSKISTRISLANAGVLSLYQNLGFKISSVLIDYHNLKET